MTQILITLGENANPSFIRKILENIRGVVKTSIYHNPEMEDGHTSFSVKEKEDLKYVKKIDTLSDERKRKLEILDKLYSGIDRSVIDYNDEKTRYILSK